MKTILLVALLLISNLAMAAKTYNLECQDNDIYTDLGTAKLHLKTQLIVNGENDYVLRGGEFKFVIDEDWTNQIVAITEVPNRQNYRPRVYQGHAKFPNISQKFFGIVDVIIAHEDILSAQKSFTGIFIMTYVEDHWGDTVSADCQLTP
jgi:hypothetical protein